MDQITLAIREVSGPFAENPIRVTEASVTDAEAVDPGELEKLLQEHGVLDYQINDNRRVVTGGASAELQTVLVTLAATASALQIADVLIRWLHARKTEAELEEDLPRAEAFIKSHFKPRGDLVVQEATHLKEGLTVRLKDEAGCSFVVSFSAQGYIIRAERSGPTE